MSIKFLPHAAAKALQWEITKGHLRAMWALDGAVSTGEYDGSFGYEKSQAFIEQFIKDFEAESFHEGFD
jgi:hypothetical protein